MKKRKHYVLKVGTYSEKIKGAKHEGLDLTRYVQDTLRECGYPCITCDDVCFQPNICEMIAACSNGSGGGPTTVGSVFNASTRSLTITVNGISSTVTLTNSPVTTSIVTTDQPFTVGSTTYPSGTSLTTILTALIANLGGTGGDNWGTQVAVTSPTLSGNGTVGSPLSLAQQSATNGQALTWNGTTWVPTTIAKTYTNGLTETTGDVEWGGTLEHDTVIAGNQKSISWENTGRIRFYTDAALGTANSYFQLTTQVSQPITLNHTSGVNVDQYAQLLVDCDGTLTRLEQRDAANTAGLFITSPTNLYLGTNISSTNVQKCGVQVNDDNILAVNWKVAANDAAAGLLGIPSTGLYVTPTGEVRMKL